MYCHNCGKEIDDKAVICTHCGVAQSSYPAAMDNSGFGWGVLGCCIPIVGLVLFLVWKDTKPKTAKVAGIGALIGVSAIIAFYAFIFGLGFISSVAESRYYY